MKAAIISHLSIGLLFLSVMTLSPQALAQDNSDPEPSEKFSREELAQMLAPIALYPDALLSQVLMASTYPIEIIEADRWIKKNPALKDEALDTALLDKDWDPSVKATCHFPSILALMSEQITQTTDLGNAFLAQEGEVMDMVQELRAKANAQGNLNTTSEQKVVVEEEKIIIEPADPRVVYVPYYDPFYIYGPWWYPSYPPYYWVPSGVSIGIGISYWPPFYFGVPYLSWSYFDWHQHTVYIVVRQRPRYVRHDRWLTKSGRWRHAPRHRRGLAYRERSTARKFGQSPDYSSEFRRDTREFPDDLTRTLSRTRDERVRTDRIRERQQPGRTETGLQEPVRTDQVKQRPQRAERVRQEQKGVERNRQQRGRTESGLQEPIRTDQVKQPRERIERTKTTRKVRKREQVHRDLQVRQQSKRVRQEQNNDGRTIEKRQRAVQKPPPPQRIEREQQQINPDKVIDQGENGRTERRSGERGRVDREDRGGNPRGRDRSDRNERGREENRGGRWW